MRYQDRIEVAIGSRPDLFPRGADAQVCVSHDDGCQCRGIRHTCSCTPDIVVRVPRGSFSIDAAGSVTPVS